MLGAGLLLCLSAAVFSPVTRRTTVANEGMMGLAWMRGQGAEK